MNFKCDQTKQLPNYCLMAPDVFIVAFGILDLQGYPI